MRFLKILFLCFSILLFIYTFYKSEIAHMGEIREYYILYYVFSSILILFSFVIFYLNKKITQNIFLILGSFLIGLYFVEFYFTYVSIPRGSDRIKPAIKKIYKEKTGKNYDTRKKFEIYDQLKENNPSYTVHFGPREIKNIYTLSSISNKNNILCNENGYYAIYLSDRYGFNNEDNVWDNKIIDYLVVGDSFAIGECVNRNNNLTGKLIKKSGKKVINLSSGGNGPLTEYALLREYLPKKVKKILWIYYEGNDQVNIYREFKSEILKKYFKDKNFSQKLKTKQKVIDALLNNIIEEEREKFSFKNENKLSFKIIKFLKIFNTRDFIINKTSFRSTEANDIHPNFKKIISYAKTLSEENGSKLYFIYISKYPRNIGLKDEHLNQRSKVKKIIQDDLNLPFIDIYELMFLNKKDPFKYFPFEGKGKHGHFNELGYDKLAEIIYNETD